MDLQYDLNGPLRNAFDAGIAIYAPMIHTAPYVMWLMRADPFY